MPGILTLANAQRAALERADAATRARLIAAYGELWLRLADRAELLGHDIATLDHPTAAQVQELARYRSLLAGITRELDRYAAYAAVEMNALAVAAIEQALRDTAALVDSYGASVAAAFTSLPADTIRTLLAFLDPAGPLFARLEQLAPYTAQAVADTIVENVARGLNPQQWAGVIQDQMGAGLSTALRYARTIQNKAYQGASAANYAHNSHVVRGWIWFAQLDHDTCMSCVAQHGTLHPVDETLDDHWNGRCTMIPHVVGVDNAAVPAGEAWFKGLPASQQRAMMGPGKYAAWQAGQFEFSALSATSHDDVWGSMRVETTLQNLTGVPA